MAQMTQEMYGAEGRVGNKTYYRSNGKTVAREIVTPKNPKTNAQTIQRVIMLQVAMNYKKFKGICDHAFEGYTMGAQCSNQFRKRGCAMSLCSGRFDLKSPTLTPFLSELGCFLAIFGPERQPFKP